MDIFPVSIIAIILLSGTCLFVVLLLAIMAIVLGGNKPPKDQ